MLAYLLRVLPYLRPYWRLGVCSIWLTIGATLFGLLSPWPLKILVDNVIGQAPLPAALGSVLGGLGSHRFLLLALTVVAGLLIAIVGGALHVLNSYVNTKLEQRIIADFRGDLFRHTERLSVAYRDQVSTARLMYAINFEAAAAGTLILSIQPLAQAGLTLVGMVWIAFRIDSTLALLSIAVVPLLYWAIRYYATHIQQRLLQVKGMEADCLSVVHDAVSMLPVITAFQREDHELERFRTKTGHAIDARVDVTVRQTLFSLAVTTTTAIGTAMVLGVGAYHAIQGTHHRRRAPRRAGVHRRRLQTAGDHQLHGRRPAGQPRRPADGVPHPRHRAGGAGGAAPRVHRPGGRRRPIRGRAFRIHRPRRHADRHLARRAAGPGRRHRRADRCGQDHADEPHPALLRSAARTRAPRRARRADAEPRFPAPADQHGAAGTGPVLRDDRRQHPLRPPAGDDGRDRRGRQGGQRPRLHRAAGRRIPDRDRRARRPPVGRRTPAHLRRARVSQGRADPHSRRAHVLDRFEDGGHHPRCARRPDGRAHHVHDRAPPVDGSSRRSHRDAGSRRAGGARDPRRADRARRLVQADARRADAAAQEEAGAVARVRAGEATA